MSPVSLHALNFSILNLLNIIYLYLYDYLFLQEEI